MIDLMWVILIRVGNMRAGDYQLVIHLAAWADNELSMEKPVHTMRIM